ncbi:MAG TPA: ABC-2 family transporter protein [Caldilineaceae bacterium]|nr:ABC-2 family transporter protein [Caldilineaceae bacterium]
MIRSIAAIYYAQLKTSLAVQFQYRMSLAIWMIGRVVQPLIYLVIWTTIARTRGGEVNGYTVGDFAAYFIMAMIVTQATFSWIMWEYDTIIRTGQFSFKLLRPVHPIHADVADNVAYKILTLIILIPAALLLAWLFPPTFNPQIWSLSAGVLAIGLAFVLRFILDWTIAMSALWTSRVSAINQTYELVFFFLSGYFAPLAVMPPAVQTVAQYLPFRWIIAFPVELSLGRLSPQEALFGFGMQLFWLLSALITLTFVWRAGVKQYSAVGS